MSYPVRAGKHLLEGIVTPEAMLAHRRRGGRLRDIAAPRGAVICLERGLPEQMKRRIGVRRAGRLLGDLYRVRGRSVLVLTDFGLGGAAVAAQAEELIALGARRLVSVALCGGIQADLSPGDIVVPTCAVRDEGTSHHYLPPGRTVDADATLVAGLTDALDRAGAAARRGPVWSTDAPYRESREEIAEHAGDGVLGVDMELAALLAVAEHRGVAAAGVLVAGDNLAGGRWTPPASLEGMRSSLQVAYAAAVEVADAG